MGPGGLHSFGHAAYFGLGAYGAALPGALAGLAPWARRCCWGRLVAARRGAWWAGSAVRLSGVSLTMLTLAFAQILRAIATSGMGFTGGATASGGVWPPDVGGGAELLVGAGAGRGVGGLLRRMLFSPFGWALRAARDSVVAPTPWGIDVARRAVAALWWRGCWPVWRGRCTCFPKAAWRPMRWACRARWTGW